MTSESPWLVAAFVASAISCTWGLLVLINREIWNVTTVPGRLTWFDRRALRRLVRLGQVRARLAVDGLHATQPCVGWRHRDALVIGRLKVAALRSAAAAQLLPPILALVLSWGLIAAAVAANEISPRPDVTNSRVGFALFVSDAIVIVICVAWSDQTWRRRAPFEWLVAAAGVDVLVNIRSESRFMFNAFGSLTDARELRPLITEIWRGMRKSTAARWGAELGAVDAILMRLRASQKALASYPGKGPIAQSELSEIVWLHLHAVLFSNSAVQTTERSVKGISDEIAHLRPTLSALYLPLAVRIGATVVVLMGLIFLPVQFVTGGTATQQAISIAIVGSVLAVIAQFAKTSTHRD